MDGYVLGCKLGNDKGENDGTFVGWKLGIFEGMIVGCKLG
jgi:hypothetical protein